MIRLFVYSFAFFAIIQRCFAEGPPIDTTGKVYTTTIVLALTPQQNIHLQSHRWLVLTKEQRKQLKPWEAPKYIDIVDPFYNDCTCGQIYAIWHTVDSIAFAVNRMQITDSVSMDDPEWGKEIFEYYNQDSNFKNHSFDIFISISGQILQNGHTLNPTTLKQTFSKIKKVEKQDYLVVYRPPRYNDDRDNKIFAAKAKIEKNLPLGMRIIWM